MTQKYEIEIPGLPEGWRPVAYRVAIPNVEYTVSNGMLSMLCPLHVNYPVLVIEKIQPRRIVLEEAGRERIPQLGEWVSSTHEPKQFFKCISNDQFSDRVTVWREVKETSIPLTNEESNLSLSVDECKEIMGKLEGCDVSLLSMKIRKFIRDNHNERL